jgi:hypothetical protein
MAQSQSVVPSIVTRRTRRHRRRNASRRNVSRRNASRRGAGRRRRQRGGGTGIEAFQVTLDSYPSRNPTTFRLSVDGMGWPREDTWKVTPPTPTPVEDVIRDWKYDTTKETTGLTLPMNPLRVEDPKTWERLQEIFNRITTDKEGPSLAAYRAYLLASSKSVGKDSAGNPVKLVTTAFCDDKWPSSKTIVHIPAYATVQSLYLDGYEYSTEQRQREAYAALPPVLVKDAPKLDPLYAVHSEPYNRPIVGTATLPPDTKVLQDYVFKPALFKLPNTKCEPVKSDKGAILLSAYKELRDRYDRHLNWVYWLLSKLVKITLRTPENELKIQFLPFLMNNPNKQTAVQMMEYVIRAASKVILNHYHDVESVYLRAVQAM